MIIILNGTATPLFFPDLFTIFFIEFLTVFVECLIIWLGFAHKIKDKEEKAFLLELVVISNFVTWLIGIVVFVINVMLF